jgi:hypothetical protein
MVPAGDDDGSAGWRKVTIHNFKRKSRTGEKDKCDPFFIFMDIFSNCRVTSITARPAGRRCRFTLPMRAKTRA